MTFSGTNSTAFVPKAAFENHDDFIFINGIFAGVQIDWILGYFSSAQ